MYPDLAPGEVSRHKCLIYEGHPSEQLPVVVPFLAEGLRNNWRCLCLGSPEMVRMVDAALRRHGTDTVAEMKRGALLFSSQRNHLENGSFDPQVMVNGIRGLIDDAVESGFEGLCATGDMRWELGSDENFDRLVEYEALLEQVFREKPLMGICQYHRDALPPRTLKDALITHRSAYLTGTLNRDNLFYMPPELLLESDRTQDFKQGEWMCEQIIRVMKAEQARDEALVALEEMNRHLEMRVKEQTEQLEAPSYSVSYALRARLQRIRSLTRLLRETTSHSLRKEFRQYMDQIENEALEVCKLTDQLLHLAGLSRMPLQSEPVNLSTIADEIASKLQSSSPERRVQFKIQPALEAQGDPCLLRVMMETLLWNAWKYTSKKTAAEIEFGAMADAGDTHYFVKDNGAGFDPKHADHLFAPYQRLPRAEELEVRGLGLATVRRIVHLHGGCIWVVADPERGATFHFTLALSSSSAV